MKTLIAGVVALTMGGAALAAPQRVVSMNLCTDLLAMMVSGPDQVVSVTYISHDPRSSPMAEEAAKYGVNHGLAEEIYLLKPDLVIAGEYSTATTTALLKRLGIPVVVFPVENDFEGMRANITAMGELLGRQEKAADLLREFDADLAAITAQGPPSHSAALYYADGFTAREDSLASRIIEAAGFSNIASSAGLTGGGVLPLEALVMAHPDLLIRGKHYGTSRAEDVLSHPALRFLTGHEQPVLADSDWSCGTPHILRAINGINEARQKLEEGGK